MRYFIYCRKSTEAEDRQVASIESQLTTLQRAFGDKPDIEILAVYEEAFSAKAPGREQFGTMIDRIESGEADGIIAWAPDRLARNSIDGGRIVYMLDRGVIKDLKFATYTFENNSQGKFMLQIMFGQSKYYSDALSDNVKRGNRTKLEHGWRPNQPPLGYLNDPVTKTTVPDELRFPVIRKIFELMLSGAYTPRQIAVISRDEWGFRTPKRKRSGGKPLAMSTVYKILSNPFYAGLIPWGGQTYVGKHKPVVTAAEFRAVRKLLDRGLPRPKRYSFAFTGLIRCGSCGLAITAEHKTNRYGYHYIYYHCSKRALGPRCPERSMTEQELERQMMAALATVEIDPEIHEWFIDVRRSEGAQWKQDGQARKASLQVTIASVRAQLNELTKMRLRALLNDDEFLAQRTELQLEQLRLEQSFAEENDASSIEPFLDVSLLSKRAVKWFSEGDALTKRQILKTVGSNLTLKGRILNIEAKKPFSLNGQSAHCPHRRAVIDDVRTNHTKCDDVRQRMREYHEYFRSEDGKRLLEQIRELRRIFEPEALARGDARRA